MKHVIYASGIYFSLFFLFFSYVYISVKQTPALPWQKGNLYFTPGCNVFFCVLFRFPFCHFLSHFMAFGLFIFFQLLTLALNVNRTNPPAHVFGRRRIRLVQSPVIVF